MKKIAILIWGLRIGGAEHVAAQLSEIFTKEGYEVYIFCKRVDRNLDYKYQGRMIPLHLNSSIMTQGTLEGLYEIVSDALIIRDYKRKFGIDITISFSPQMNFLNLISGAGDKKILTFHSCQSLRNDFQGLLFRPNIIKLGNLADKVITVSQWCRNDLVKNYGINRKKIKVIYNPIEPMSSFKFVEKENIVLIVGRLQDIKQQWHAIRAFSHTIKKIPDARLIIAGQGENETYLKNLANGLELGQVSFMGFVDDMAPLYRKAKVLVFCSASEALPCSVLEAISYGVPIVATDCPGGIREILTVGKKKQGKIKGIEIVKGGVLVPSVSGEKYDANAPLEKAEIMLAKGIELLLSNDDIYRRLTQNCIKISKLFYKDRIFRYWKEVFEDIL